MNDQSCDIEGQYLNESRRKLVITAIFLVIAVVMAFGSIFIIDYTGLTADVIWDVICAHLNGSEYGVHYYDLIVWEYTVPRSIMAVVAGIGLAIGGAVMQSLMRNPLAEPYTTGVASGASFGAAIFIILGIAIVPTSVYSLNLTINATLMALVPTVAIVLISRRKTITPTTMILAGITIMYVFRACTSFLTLTADPENVEQLYLWNVGTVGSARWDNIWIVALATLVCGSLLMLLADRLTIMSAGDRCATTMGVKARSVRVISLILIAVLTATIVGYTGTIGFMGLVAPHIARMFVGSNLRYLIPCSAAVGAFVLVACDCLARVLSTSGLSVGVITSIIGGPIFIILLIKGAKKVWY